MRHALPYLLLTLLVFVACADDGSIDTAPQDTGVLDTGSAQTEDTATHEADTQTEDSAGFDTELSDTNAPDTHTQDADTPDTYVSDTSAPDTNTPDTSAPDTGMSDTGSPHVGTPCSVGGLEGVCLDVAECDGERESTPGFCPGPANIQCCTETQPTMMTDCDPNVRPNPNAGLTEEAVDPNCPDGMLQIDAFCIDMFEASLMIVDDNGNATYASPYFNPENARIRAISLRGAVPQGYITGIQAEAACLEADKRLCTDEEWLRACQGSANLTFPYGATRQPGVCNDARAMHPVVELFGTGADWIWSELDHPCISQQHNTLAETGAYSGCVTQEGVHDMMGNLHEWTAASSGIFRGGFYADTERNGPGCLYRTTAHNRFHWDYSTGFRCCSDR